MQRRLQNAIIVTQEFKNVFDTIVFNIGIKETLELNDFDRIFNFLQRNFGLITLSQINEAFDLYSAQKLDFKDSHFNSFDNVFIGKLLKAYNEYKNEKQRKPPKIEYKPVEGVKMRNGQVDNRTPYSLEAGKSAFEWTKEQILKDGKLPYIADWINACRYMEETGIIKLDAAEKEVMENALRAKLNLKKGRRDTITGALNNMVGSNFKVERSKELISEHFKKELVTKTI